MIALLFAAQSPCEKQAERKRQTVSVGMKCREVFRDADCLAICPACPPKCYAFRYRTAHQLPEKQFTGLFFYGSCPLRVRVPKDLTKAKTENTLTAFSVSLWWAFRDSNPGPTGYEPVALTN